MNQTGRIIIAGCLSAALAVMIGAFGAHGLKDLLQMNDRMETYELAVRYHFYHSFGILFVGLLSPTINLRWAWWACILHCLGIIFFSGSLYVLAITNQRMLGMITPIGGVMFIAGWLLVIAAIFQSQHFRKRSE